MKRFMLNQDVKGPCSRILYGRKGDEAIVIADHGDMLIVEGGGQRYPVRKTSVSEMIDESPKIVLAPLEILIAPEPVKAEPVQTRWKAKQTKTVNSNPTLF